MKVFFLVMNEMRKALIPSQVLAPARCYAQRIPDADVAVVFLEPARVAARRPARERLAALRASWPEGDLRLYPYVGRLGERAPARTLGLATFFERRGHSPVVFHCRGPAATLQAANLREGLGTRVVFDARGASGPESRLRVVSQGRGADAAERAFEAGVRLDRMAAEAADAVLAVSGPLAAELRALSGGTKEPVVVPCCLERTLFSSEARARTRARLGLANDELLFVHTSTSAYWESFEDVLRFFRHVAAARPARLLFLTTLDAELVLSSLPAADPLRGAISVRRAAPSEVGDYLSAADAGVLLRRPHPSHAFASPIKFAEYLGAGLAVVANEGIGATEVVVRGQGVGVVVDPVPDEKSLNGAADRVVALLAAEPDAVRRRAIDVCEREFLWTGHVDKIERAYRGAGASPDDSAVRYTSRVGLRGRPGRPST